jgi:hypothetical protein
MSDTLGPSLPNGDRFSLENVLDEFDERQAARYRFRLGVERKLVSWSRVGKCLWESKLSHEDLPELRFVRRGKTRVRAIENSEAALEALLKVMRSRGQRTPPTNPKRERDADPT